MRRTSADTEEIRLRLAEIESRNGGVLTPDAVVEDAKDEKSPLHRYFEWNAKKAAQAYWLIQARELITSIKVETRTETRTVCVPYYVHDPSVESDEQGYVSVKTLRNDEDLAREALHAEFKRAAAALTRATGYAVTLSLEKDVDRLLKGVIAIQAKLAGVAAVQQ